MYVKCCDSPVIIEQHTEHLLLLLLLLLPLVLLLIIFLLFHLLLLSWCYHPATQRELIFPKNYTKLISINICSDCSLNFVLAKSGQYLVTSVCVQMENLKANTQSKLGIFWGEKH